MLVVEDELQMKRYLTTLLESSGFGVLECDRAQSAISAAAAHAPELILLDLGLPDFDGLTVISSIRQWSSVPIIVISARDQETTKVEALDRGADDYLTKPFGAAELMARIRVAIRHSTGLPADDEPLFINGPLRIEFATRKVFRDDEVVELTPTEYNLLLLLVRNMGKVLIHRQILREVWGPNAVDRTHYVRIYMANLRKKLEADPAHPRFLITETGVGYRLKEIESD
ncbi:MAG: response regulator [Bradymonadaceae bacterium]